MISIDLVYQTVKTLANTDVRGNAKPDEMRLLINLVVDEIIENYFSELEKAINRVNRGYGGTALENIPKRIREKVLYFLTEDTMTFTTPYFTFPNNYRYIDSITFNDIDIEECKNMREFKSIVNLQDTTPTESYPIYIQLGDKIKVAPSTINENVFISYLRSHLIAKWSFTEVLGNEVFNPSANDFQDIDLHSSELSNVILKTLLKLGISLKESDIVQYMTQNEQIEYAKTNQG
tara:strand:+ start:9545 stop:10246 length:702 start_codon:yes stop_codon:yes gene_type:complete